MMVWHLPRSLVKYGELAIIIVLSVGQPAMAENASVVRVNYLQGGSIGYTPAPAPTNHSAIGQHDLDAVRIAHGADAQRMTEAYEDSRAYEYDLLLPRFSVAAGTDLSLRTRPIMAHMVKWLLADAGVYVTAAKYSDLPNVGTPANKRMRPYREDRSIVPCETDYLYTSDDQSYPSGHATNGYIAALLVADIISPKSGPRSNQPDRRSLIISRGIRYGENRAVCGVHYPSDIRAGQDLAQHIYVRALADSEFRQDLECARQEDLRSPASRQAATIPEFSPACQTRNIAYVNEAEHQSVVRTAERFDLQE